MFAEKKERLKKAIALEKPDRPPILGGWLAVPAYLQKLAGCSPEEYWQDPFRWGVEAERVLGSDGLIEVFKCISQDEFRFIDEKHYASQKLYSVERIVSEFINLPDPEEIWQKFDEEAEYGKYVQELLENQARCQDMLWCPADWELIPRGLCYYEYGYENAMTVLALYPEVYRRWIRVNAAKSRQKALIYSRAIQDGYHPGMILSGEDLNSQQGPLVSPAFLRKELFPLIEYSLEPLLQVGAKIILHCDGDYRVLLNDMLALGINGLQGFQEECGMDLEWIVKLKSCKGDSLLICGPMSVTTTLPFGDKNDIAAFVKRAMDLCRDRASLIFFTSNTINPDVPMENILFFWQTVLDSRW